MQDPKTKAGLNSGQPLQKPDSEMSDIHDAQPGPQRMPPRPANSGFLTDGETQSLLPQLQSEVDKSNTLQKIIVKDSIEERQAKMLARCLVKGNVCCFMGSPPAQHSNPFLVCGTTTPWGVPYKGGCPPSAEAEPHRVRQSGACPEFRDD